MEERLFPWQRYSKILEWIYFLWQLFCRFDVGRDLHFDEGRTRVAWDATAPIPSKEGPLPVRRWPAVTLHDPDLVSQVDAWLSERL